MYLSEASVIMVGAAMEVKENSQGKGSPQRTQSRLQIQLSLHLESLSPESKLEN